MGSKVTAGGSVSDASSAEPGPERKPRGKHRDLLGGGIQATMVWGVAAAALVAIFYTLVAFPLGIGAAISWGGDSFATYMLAENFHRFGPTQDLPGLAYPYGGSLVEFPLAPNYIFILSLWIASLIAGGDVIVAANLATVMLVTINAAAAYACLALITKNGFASACGSILFALTYFAFSRAVVHTVVLSYSAVPLSFLALHLVSARADNLTRRRLAVASIVAVLAGLSNAYYVTFSVLVFGAAFFAQAFSERRYREMVAITLCCLLILFAALVVSWPVLLHRLQHGVNPAISLLTTTSATAELNAMRLSQVVTYPGVRPVFGGSSLYEWLARGKPVSETWSNYSGALVVIAGVCFTYFLWSWRTLAGSTRRFLVLGAFAASLAVLLFVPGGLGDVLIYLLQQIRALNRGVVILQFLAALLFTMMLARLVSSSWRLRSAGLVFAAVAIVYALVDQSRSPDKATAQSANAAAIADRSFFEKVAAAHHQKPFAMLQLPYQAFPEFSGPNGMGTNDSLVPFILTRNLRTSAASFPQTAAFFNSLNMQDLFRAGRFGDLVRALTESGISSVVFDRRGLSEFEKRRLGQLSLVLAGSLDGGSADQFVHFSLERPVQNAADFQPSGLFLASYGPIGFGLEAVKPSYSKSGGPTAELPQSSIILVNRYEDRQMKAVIQFLAECKTPTTIKILSGGEVGTVGLTNEPFMLNLPVNLAEPQARIALQFDVPPSGCSIRNPAVTFFE